MVKKRHKKSCDIQWWWEAKNRNIYGNQILDEIIDSNIIHIYIQNCLLLMCCTHTGAEKSQKKECDIDNEIQLTNDDLCDRGNHVNLMTTLSIFHLNCEQKVFSVVKRNKQKKNTA